MTATQERPDTAEQTDQLQKTNRGLLVALIVTALIALGLGAWGVWQATTTEEAVAAPDGVVGMTDTWFAALEQGDESVLDLYVTGGFHQYATERYFGEDIVRHLSAPMWTHEWITDPYVITNEGDGTYVVVRGMRNTEPASGSSEASAIVFEIETGDGGDLEIASSQWIYRTTWRDVE